MATKILKGYKELAQHTKGKIFEVKCRKDIEFEVILTRGNSLNFNGSKETFYLEQGDTHQIVIDTANSVYMVDLDSSKWAWIKDKTESKRFLEAMSSSTELADYSEEPETKGTEKDGKYTYYVCDRKIQEGKFEVKFLTYKNYDKPKDGIYAEFTTNTLLSPKDMIKFELRAGSKDQSYDLGFDREMADKNKAKDYLLKRNLKDKTDIINQASSEYNKLGTSGQYFLDDKFHLFDNYIGDLDIQTLARLLRDLEAIS